MTAEIVEYEPITRYGQGLIQGNKKRWQRTVFYIRYAGLLLGPYFTHRSAELYLDKHGFTKQDDGKYSQTFYSLIESTIKNNFTLKA